MANANLRKLRELLDDSQPPASTPSDASLKSNLTHDEIMAKYKIANDGEKYIYQGYRYDNLQDAVAYAIKHKQA